MKVVPAPSGAEPDTRVEPPPAAGSRLEARPASRPLAKKQKGPSPKTRA